MTQFSSPRQALAYTFAAQRGPQLARPRRDDAPGSTGHSSWDHAAIATMLYGPQEQGLCGVVRDSALDRELRQWATTAGHPRSPAVRRVEIRMRNLLREHGLMPMRRRRVARLRFFGKDPHTGIEREHDHLVEAYEPEGAVEGDSNREP